LQINLDQPNEKLRKSCLPDFVGVRILPELLLLLTGASCSEITQAKWECVNWQRQTLWVLWLNRPLAPTFQALVADGFNKKKPSIKTDGFSRR
jgi:integrase